MRGAVAIVGATGVGKSRLALELAPRFRGEIINADSRQVYRYLGIGTAKPTPEERDRVPHHLLDIAEPDQPLSLALYQRLAYQAIEGVLSRGNLPFLVGGTGLYMWAVVEGWRIPPVPPDPRLRRELEERVEREGTEPLYQRLRELDPQAARRIDPRNRRRVIRALEVCLAGIPFSTAGKASPPYPWLIIGLTLPRPELYRRIDTRVEEMIERGLVAEVKALRERGYPSSLPALSGVGYREIWLHLEGRLSLEEAVQRIKFRTHRYARQQGAWFRPQDPRIHWVDINEGITERVALLIERWLRGEVHQVPSDG